MISKEEARFDQKHVDLDEISNGSDQKHIDLESMSIDQKHVDLEAISKVLTKNMLIAKQ